jgi:hypothetical protein
MYVSKDYYAFEGSVMSIDPAGRGADRTAYAVVKSLNGLLYLTDCGSFQGGYEPETLKLLAIVAKTNSVNHIVIESNFGDGMFNRLLEPILTQIYPCTIEEIRSSVQKEKRIIDTLEPVMNSHRLIVDQDIIKSDFRLEKEHQLFYQMTRLTKTKGCLRHDDQIDVLAMAVGYWNSAVGRSIDQADQLAKEERLNAELDKFMRSALGQSKRRSNSFIN